MIQRRYFRWLKSIQAVLTIRHILHIAGILITLAFLLSSIFFFNNNYEQEALAAATIALPESELPASPTISPETTFCFTADFLADESLHLFDNGTNGDPIPNDGVHSIVIIVDEPGRYEWQITACDDHSAAFPLAGAAWFNTEGPNQAVRFTLDTNQYQDGYYPPSFVVNAQDSGRILVAIGDFQGWDNEAEGSVLLPSTNGRLQRIFTIAEPGAYTGLVVVKGTWDGYMAHGRSTEWRTFRFRTLRPDEKVAFLFDPKTGRTSIRYHMPVHLEHLAFAGLSQRIGFWLIGLGMITAVLQGWFFIRYRPQWQERAGCPQCGGYQLSRIRRTSSDMLLNWIGFPIRRHMCKTCGWQGRRF